MGLDCVSGRTVLRDGDFFTAEKKFLKSSSVGTGGDNSSDRRGGATAKEVEIKHSLHGELFPVETEGSS